MTAEERFDGLFMTAIQQSNGIETFFGNLFSFMRRKTDFFTLADKSQGIVVNALNQQMAIYNEGKQREAALKAKQEAEKKKREEKEKEDAAKKKQGESTAEVEEVTEEEAMRIMAEEARKKEERAKAASEPAASSSSDEKKAEDSPAKEGEEEEKKDKGLKPNLGNGCDLANYRWTQTLEELTIYVPLPDGIVAKQLDVVMKGASLKIGVKGQPAIIDGPLHKKIKVAESLWTLEKDGNKRTLQMTLAKVEGMNWWSSIIEGDPKIDTSKVEPENSKLSDLDSETRSTVEKMMFD